jgi:hypothetical protein
VLAALTGALASGRLAEARALHDRYVPSLSQAQRDGLALNLVLAHLKTASVPSR